MTAPFHDSKGKGNTAPDVVRRSWGYFQVLEEEKRDQVEILCRKITVHPGRHLSLHYHRFHREHWLILFGEALVTLNGQTFHLHAGESVDIPKRAPHVIANACAEDLCFVEVQQGEYVGADDVVFFEHNGGA